MIGLLALKLAATLMLLNVLVIVLSGLFVLKDTLDKWQDCFGYYTLIGASAIIAALLASVGFSLWLWNI